MRRDTGGLVSLIIYYKTAQPKPNKSEIDALKYRERASARREQKNNINRYSAWYYTVALGTAPPGAQ